MWLWGAAAGAGALLWVARPFRVAVQGTSMAPAVKPGDYLAVTRPRRISAGAVVVVRHPARDLELLKRVVALPGETSHGVALGPDQYLVVGDNTARSTDGRAFGPVDRQAIRGVVRFRYWPRPGRVGMPPA